MSDQDRSVHIAEDRPSVEPRARKKRLQLSCLECRRKKLSCSRTLPCQRCTRIGRADECSFESRPQQPGVDRTSQNVSQNEIERLTAELQKVKAELDETRAHFSPASSVPAPEPRITTPESGPPQKVRSEPLVDDVLHNELSSRPVHAFYRQNNLIRFFAEIPDLYPLIKETTSEWLRPAGVALAKDKHLMKSWESRLKSRYEGSWLEDLFPPQTETNMLVDSYIDTLEYLHRILHVPTFKAEYSRLWNGEHGASRETMILVLAVLAVTVSSSSRNANTTVVADRFRARIPSWIVACEEWLNVQSHKRRDLTYYQIACLVYFTKRLNLIQKKRYWTETGRLVQEAMLDRLYDDSSPTSQGVFAAEMRRRIWCVIREMDLQTSFEFGMPSILHSLEEPRAVTPANIEDEAFDKSSVSNSNSSPTESYGRMSYQCWSAHSWSLRLRISRRLFSSGTPSTLSYDEVLHYTQEVTHAIQQIQNWENSLESSDQEFKAKMLLTSSALYFQLQECILAIHRPYLRRENSKFWLSGNICRQIAHEMLMQNLHLAKLGIQGTAFLREHLLLSSLTITRLTLLQPTSTTIPLSASSSALDLLEQCLPLAEDRYLQQFPGEPWCFLTLCAAIMLLKVHLGREHRQTAKYSCAQRFLDLHARHCARRVVPAIENPSRDGELQTPDELIAGGDTTTPCGLDDEAFDFNTELLDFDLDLAWEDRGDWTF